MDFKELKFEPVSMETSNTAASIMVTRHNVSIGHYIREKMGSSGYFQIQVNKENKILKEKYQTLQNNFWDKRKKYDSKIATLKENIMIMTIWKKHIFNICVKMR